MRVYVEDSYRVSSEAELFSDFDARDHLGLLSGGEEEIYTGKGINVVIMDTGIYPNHSVFTDKGRINWEDRILVFYDAEKEDTVEEPYDVYWHGTWAASILGGNNTDYKGVAPDLNFIVMKVFYEEEGEITSTTEDIDAAVDWVLENKKKYDIKIVSMSFGAAYEDNPEETQELNDIVTRLTEENILVVASAGNYGDNPQTISSPGSAPSVMTVGGVDFDNEMYKRSGRGPTFENIIKPDVCAPAVNILGAEVGPPDDLYSIHSGTSASTPYVSGLAAFMLEKEEDLNWKELKAIISLTSWRTIEPYTLRDNIQGWGVVQGYAALDALDSFLELNLDSQFEFSLDQGRAVFCQPIQLDPYTHYFFSLTELDSADAEIYVFDSRPDENGVPLVRSKTLDIFSASSNEKRCGIFTDDEARYYLLVKLVYDTGDGKFQLNLILDARLMIIFGLLIVNLGALVYTCKLFYKGKKRR